MATQPNPQAPPPEPPRTEVKPITLLTDSNGRRIKGKMDDLTGVKHIMTYTTEDLLQYTTDNQHIQKNETVYMMAGTNDIIKGSTTDEIKKNLTKAEKP